MENKSTDNGFYHTDLKRSPMNHYLDFFTSNNYETVHNPQILFIFPNVAYEMKQIDQITDKLPIQYTCVQWPKEQQMDLIQSDYFDLIIVDYWAYASESTTLAELMKLISSKNRNSTTSIIAYMNQQLESFHVILEAGFCEMWFNYKPILALRNSIISYTNNQFRMKNVINEFKILFDVFTNFGEVIEILDENFDVKFDNSRTKRNDQLHPDKIKNWFELHDITSSVHSSIISTLNQYGFWEGVTNKRSINAEKDVAPNNYFTTIKKIPSERVYFVNKIKVSGSMDYSLSLNSIDSTVTIPKNKEIVNSVITIDSPILQILKIINSIQDFCNPVVKYYLQIVIDILNQKDLFNTTVDPTKNDNLSSNLIEGLLGSNTTIYSQTENRRQSSSLMKRRTIRDNSEIIHDHISQVLAKASKISDIPENAEMSAIDELLEKYSKWDFDIVSLEKLTEKKALRFLGMKIYRQFDMGATLQIDSKLFQNWLNIIESNYNESNTYHNSTHAADVLQSSVYFLETNRINDIFDSFDDAASIIAAIIHDLGHPGRTNPFLINSNHNLAVLYNDVAVLENHHASFAFKITLKDDRINIFKKLNRDDYRSLRHSIIDSVLATEMAKHFEHLTKFVNTVMRHPDIKVSSQLRPTSVDNNIEEPINLSSPENKSLIRRMLIKCSDVNNPTRPFDLCKEWAHRISEEYFNQTDEEIAKGLPVVMPHFNRKTCVIPKSQISFIELFLEDMFRHWSDFIERTELTTYLVDNKVKWNDSLEVMSENNITNSNQSREVSEVTQ